MIKGVPDQPVFQGQIVYGEQPRVPFALNRKIHILPHSGARFFASAALAWCRPGMGVNLWGERPLYVNPHEFRGGVFE